ncbi:MAG: shikimate dehydrogenase, partial [Verrucomicrobia bacterium]|nr:shikimate dehydrogenase [Verrucomicrobiota bacterium]
MKSGAEVFRLKDLRAWSHGAPVQLAVLGDPVAHSASPPMHNAALLACGLPHVYGRLHIRPEELHEAIPLLARAGFIGVNLTIPHKLAVIPMLDAIEPRAKLLGAVNTIALRNGGLR